jgi:hypothetical protein
LGISVVFKLNKFSKPEMPITAVSGNTALSDGARAHETEVAQRARDVKIAIRDNWRLLGRNMRCVRRACGEDRSSGHDRSNVIQVSKKKEGKKGRLCNRREFMRDGDRGVVTDKRSR